MSEKTITRQITQELRKRGWWVIKIHGSPYQRKGLPDLLCLSPTDQETMFVEVKCPGRKLTKLQAATIYELRTRGFPALVAHSWREVAEYWGWE